MQTIFHKFSNLNFKIYFYSHENNIITVFCKKKNHIILSNITSGIIVVILKNQQNQILYISKGLKRFKVFIDHTLKHQTVIDL